MEASDIKRLNELEEENRRRQQMYADLSLDHKMLTDIVNKKSCKSSRTTRARRLREDGVSSESSTGLSCCWHS
ncbi:MAG: hypothetical protein HOI20_27725 [Gemmatimonadetes bacterium]|jgi:hypothetical protein|nr:hypothetical protein [Gemmatimonadota bacterium]